MRQSGKQIIEQGMNWIANEPNAWKQLKQMVREDVRDFPGAELRIAYYVERLRAMLHAKIPNAIQPYLSRRLEREIKGAHFSKSKSKLNLLMAGEDDV